MADIKMTAVTSWVTLALLVGSAAGLLAPRLIPEQDEIVVQAGESFTLRCESPQPINWSYPIYQDNRSNSRSMLNVSYGETGDPEYPHVSNLQVTGAYFMDTGFYYCTEEGEVSLTSNDRVSRIFVYVNDSMNLLVRVDETFLTGYENNHTVLPCRPTFPDVRVTLRDKDGEDMMTDPRVTFSPKLGYTISSLSLDDTMTYECQAAFGDYKNQSTIQLQVLPSTVSMATPEVTLLTANVVEGDMLKLNCSISMEADVRFRLTWKTPNDESRRTQRLEVDTTSMVIVMHEGRSKQIGYRVLTVNNANSADNGMYTCTVRDQDGQQQSHDYKFTVHDRAYISIVSGEKSDNIPLQVGDPEVTWVIEFKTYVPPTSLVWLDPKNQSLVPGPDFKLSSSANTAQLTIRNISLDKAGKYTLVISNDKNTRKVIKKLEMTGPPDVTEIKGASAYYADKQNYTIRCKILANPPAKIEWKFQNCSSYTNCSNETKLIQGARSYNRTLTYGLYGVRTSINVTTEESGLVTCVANNTLGVRSQTLKFFVADVTEGFGIIKPAETVERHEMVLTCRASKYNFSSIIEWFKDGKPLNTTDDFNVTSGSTKFSHESSLTVRKLAKSHSGNYTCSAKNLQKRTENVTLNVKVTRKRSLELENNTWSPSEKTSLGGGLLVIVVIIVLVVVFSNSRRQEGGGGHDSHLSECEEGVPVKSAPSPSRSVSSASGEEEAGEEEPVEEEPAQEEPAKEEAGEEEEV